MVRPRNIVSRATKFCRAKATARWATRSPSIKCSRAMRTVRPPVARARSRLRRSLRRSVHRRLRLADPVVSVVRRFRPPAASEAPPQGEGDRCSRRTTPTTRVEARRRFRRRNSNNRRLRSVIRISNTAKIKAKCRVDSLRRLKVASVDRRPIKGSADLRRFSNRRRNTEEGSHPRGEGVHRRRTADSRSLLHNSNRRLSAALRRSIRIPRIACSAHFSSRTKIIRRVISGRCSAVA